MCSVNLFLRVCPLSVIEQGGFGKVVSLLRHFTSKERHSVHRIYTQANTDCNTNCALTTSLRC